MSGGADWLITLCRNGEPPQYPIGFTGQEQIVDAPAKCHDLRLELYSDTSDARHLLARERFYQLPRRY